MSAILSGHECVNLPLNGIHINGDPIYWRILMPRPIMYFLRSHAWPENLAICFVILCIKTLIWWYCFRKTHRQHASITKQFHAHLTKEQKQHGFYTLLLIPKCQTLLQSGKLIGADYHLDITSHWKRTVTTDSVHCRPQWNPKVKIFSLL